MSSHVAYKPSQELPGDVGFEDWVTIVAPVTIAIPAQQFALRVQAGYRRFNGASIPRWAQWFLGDPFDPAYVPPALVHDYLYDLPSKRGEVGYKGRRPIQKDGIDLAFYELLIDNGVTASTASVMYWAVAYYPHGAYQPGPADPLNAFDPSVSQESMASQSSASTSFAEPLRRTRDLTPARQEREAVLLHAAPVLKRLTLARDDAGALERLAPLAASKPRGAFGLGEAELAQLGAAYGLAFSATGTDENGRPRPRPIDLLVGLQELEKRLGEAARG